MHEMRTQQGNNPQKTSKEQADTRLLRTGKGSGWNRGGGSGTEKQESGGRDDDVGLKRVTWVCRLESTEPGRGLGGPGLTGFDQIDCESTGRFLKEVPGKVLADRPEYFGAAATTLEG
jgi:hypothetical protein